MSDAAQSRQKTKSVIMDIFIVLFCLGGAAASLYLFQRDLFATMRSFVNTPAGTVSVKYNTVQRRFKDRTIWDRLNNESPVYNGDLIRVARLSGALITIDNNSIELGENTLIRIQKEGESANIDFFSGEVNISSAQDSGTITLSIGDKVVQAESGTVFSASSGEEGIVLRVTEGSAQITSSGQTALAPAGTVIAQDVLGNEKVIPAASVIQPRPNARYLKTQELPFNLNFEWTRINMQRNDPVRLEIAEDRNFSRVRHVLDNLDSSAVAAVGAGLWNWRLMYESTVLASGRVTVTEASSPSLFNAVISGPDAQLRWVEVEEASGYIVQLSKVTDFTSPAISAQVQGTAFVMPDIDIGTWYWRVRPVFSSAYEGASDFSPVSSFQVDIKELPSLSLIRPVNESNIDIDEAGEGIYFSWSHSRDAASYTIQVSSQGDPDGSIINRTVSNNYFLCGKNEASLVPGHYYWSVFYTDARGNISPVSQKRSFLITQKDVVQRLIYPPDSFKIESENISALRFSWETNLLSDRRFQVSAREDFSSLTVDAPAGENNYQGLTLPAGEWYWRVSARRTSMSQAFATLPRRLTLTSPVLPEAAAQPVAADAPQTVAGTPSLATDVPPVAAAAQPEAAAAQQAAAEAPSAAAEAAPPTREAARAETQTTPLRLRLVSPSSGSSITGLTALRQPTIFRWECDEEIAGSRFILSRSENPAQGRAEVEILNPGRSVTVNSLGEGLWYWTVIAQSRDGRPITAASAGQLLVQPIPLLPSPENRQPASGYSIGEQILRQQRNIVFRWDAVNGANSYILTIFRETPSGRTQIFKTDALRQISFTFDSFSLFDYTGTYVWQVEALYYTSQGIVEQHGRPGENTFTLNVPRPGRVETRDAGILYGN